MKGGVLLCVKRKNQLNKRTWNESFAVIKEIHTFVIT